MAGPLDLVFLADDRAPLELVFGDDGAAGTGPEYSIAGAGTITGLGRAQAGLAYDFNVQRQALALRGDRWQDGRPIGRAVRTMWERASELTHVARVVNEPGAPASSAIRSTWQDARALLQIARVHDQVGVHVGIGVRSAFEQALELSAGVRSRSQPGVPLAAAVRSQYQETVRLSRYARSAFEPGRPVIAATPVDMQPGVPIRSVWRVRFQRARLPLPGGLPPGPGPDNRDDWCYVPANPIELLFEADDRAPLELVFRCEQSDGPAPQPSTIVIPVRRSYVVHNSVTLYRLPSGAEFEAKSFSLDLDADSWTFGWSASLHSSAAAHMTRSPSGERVEVECVVNGVHLRLVVDGKGPDRRFPEHRIQVRGRGRAAELADPSLTFGNTAARTAQQLMADVLTVNGVSMGWGIDWGIEDWLVPADAWVFSGSYIDALRDIAGAAGAYLQPHLTDQVIRVLPRYPLAPWHWANLAVGVELPVEATSVEGIEEVIRPDYNQVHLGGLKAPAVFGPFKRTGTAGDKEAPQVNHALITAAEVHRQRGQAILSDTGLQEHVSISTMLWPETGIIMPGTVLRYVSDDGPRTGIVRKTGLSMQQWPQLVQTLGVETHVE